MLTEFLNRLLELKLPETVRLSERDYSTLSLEPVLEPAAAPIKVHTLTALVTYLKDNVDLVSAEKFFLHVASHDCVELVSMLEPKWRKREFLVQAGRGLHGDGFKFGMYHDAESFVVELQSKFMDTPTRAKVLAIAGNLRQQGSVSTSDNGITQSVETKAGVVLATQVDVPNLVVLKPYRTFLEVDQPESAFIFRVKKGREGDLPQSALFEADGGRWKLEAIQKIKLFLADALPEFSVIA